jgi:hypothetical protein
VRTRRIEAFKALIGLVGSSRATRIAGGWARAFAEAPELKADLALLGFLEEPAVRVRGGRPAPLPADELQFREGARSLARAIMDRAGLTYEDIRDALAEMDHEQALADALRRAGEER